MHPAHSIGPNESIRAAAEQMAKANVPAIYVVEEGKVLGLLTNRNLIRNAIAHSLSPDETKVSDVMDPWAARISDDREVDNALLVMQVHGISELLVQDFTGQIVGIFCDCGCCHARR